jgi:predicted amidohydrolase
MKEEIKVARAQMDVTWLDPPANARKVREWVERISSEQRPDLIVFPAPSTTA